MIAANSINKHHDSPPTFNKIKIRQSVESNEPAIFADIYREEINIAIWKRQLQSTLQGSVSDLLRAKPALKLSTSVRPKDVVSELNSQLGETIQQDLSEDIAKLVDMFCLLFDIERAGLRLTALDRAMCPKFHVDRVPCRLITTYSGCATEWLPHMSVNRKKLGVGSKGLPDEKSGLLINEAQIQQLNCGAVGLLKGESWQDNENAGLVHRSPAPAVGENRLLLTLDFSI